MQFTSGLTIEANKFHEIDCRICRGKIDFIVWPLFPLKMFSNVVVSKDAERFNQLCF